MKSILLLLLLCSLSASARKPISKVRFHQQYRSGGLIVTLDGSLSRDPDGWITKYRWRQIGIAPSRVFFTDSSSAITTAQPGVWYLGDYLIELEVTDNSGGTGRDTATITVVSGNTPPIVVLSGSPVITLPTRSVMLSGTATDLDGIESIVWKVAPGTGITITNGQTMSPTIGNLVAGSYIASVTVTDKRGAVSSGSVAIRVNPQPCGFWDKLFHNHGCHF